MTRCSRDVLLIVLLSVVLGASFTKAELSDFQKTKIKRQFYVLDADHDGWLQQQDLHDLVNRISRETDYNKYNLSELHCTIVPKAWDAFPGMTVNQTQLLTIAGNLTLDAITARIIDQATLMFNVWDYIDPEGSWIEEELKGEFESLQIDPDLSHIAFVSLDANNDTMITLEEFVDGAIKFVTSNNETDPSRYLLGALTPIYPD